MTSKDEITNLWDSYNNLLLGDDISRIRKLLVRYELFKKTLNIPGDIVECGVFKGSGFMYWLKKLLKIYSHNSQKRVLGFDTFSSFAGSLLDYEKKSVDEFVDESNFKGIDVNELSNQTSKNGFSNFELIKGDVKNNPKKYVQEKIKGLEFHC